MTITAQPISVPSLDLLLSQLVWTATPGTATTVTYCFLQQTPNPLFAPIPGNPTEDIGWTPLSAAEQKLVQQAMTEISAVANLTFQASTDPTTAQILLGSDQQTVTVGFTAYAGTPVINATQKQLTQTHIEFSVGMPLDGQYLWVALHEIANSTGLADLAGDTQVSPPQNSETYSIESYASGANAYDYYAPGSVDAVTPQILDIVAWQYLYGANQSGFTPSTVGVSESHIGNDHSYRFTDGTAPMTVWIGANVSGTNCFDFSACSGIVTIDLTPGAVSSTGRNDQGASITVSGTLIDVSNVPYQNAGIAYGTSIQIGIANAAAGATLIANDNKGSTSLMIGGHAADICVAGGGYDIFVAAGGVDSAIFHDPAADYTLISGPDGEVMVTDHAASPSDGTVVLVGDFTHLQFSDQTIAESPAAPSASATANAVLGTAAWAQADLGVLQSFVADGYVSSLILTDTSAVTLSVTAAQSVDDAKAIASLSGNFSLTIDASAADATVVGPGDGHAVIVLLPDEAAAYDVTPDGDGTGFSLSDGANTDQLSNVTALQFADHLAIVASQTPVHAGGISSAQVATLYAAVLARIPDASGLAFYENFASGNPGYGFQTYAQWFLSSPEYSHAHAYTANAAGDAQFITDTYQNLLKRAPETGAVQFYQDNVIVPMLQGLAAGTAAYQAADLQAHARVLTYFSQSAEFLADVQVTAQHPADAQHWLIVI